MQITGNMQSTFLAIDHYSCSSPTEAVSGFDPISLPVPLLDSPDPPPLPDLLLSELDLGISVVLDEFHFENALDEFLSDVLPRFLHPEESTASQSRSGEMLTSICNGDLENPRCIESGTDFPQVMEAQVERLFEVVEVGGPLDKHLCSDGGNDSGLSLKIPDLVLPLGVVEIQEETIFVYPHKVAKSIFCVENILAMSVVDKECTSHKERSYSVNDKTEMTLKLPLFDVMEMDLGSNTSLTSTRSFTSLLSEISPLQGCEDELLVNADEFPNKVGIDVMDIPSGNIVVENSIEHAPASLGGFLDMNVINLNNQLLASGDSGVYPIIEGVHYAHQPCSVHFQEIQILDSSSHVFHVFGGLSAAKVLEMSDKMLEEDMEPVRNLYGSFISSEIALADEHFKSIPEPIFEDEELIKSLNFIFRDILVGFQTQSYSACDGIYLDWHPLLEGWCKREPCVANMQIVEEVSVVPLELNIVDRNKCLDAMIFYESQSEILKNSENKEPSAKILAPECFGVNPVAVHSTAETVDQICKYERISMGEKTQESTVNREKVSLIFDSMSHSSDLNYFLDVRKGKCRKSCEDEARIAKKIMPHVVCVEDSCGLDTTTQVCHQEWKLEIHQVNISDNWLILLKNFQSCYFGILEKCTELRKLLILLLGKDFQLLSIPKQLLLHLITEKGPSQITSGQSNEIVMAASALYAIKKLAYFLCFSSIRDAYLYIKNLTRSNDYFAAALRPIEYLTEAAFRKTESQLSDLHPSLPLIQEILISNASQNGSKILLVAQKDFWFPLKQMLMSMMSIPYEVDVQKFSEGLKGLKLTSYFLNAMQESNYLLISPEEVCASLPFDKFSIILEYGGLHKSSKIVSIPSAPHFPPLHFLRLDLEKHEMLKALSEGHDVPQNQNSTMGNYHNHSIVKLLDFLPPDDRKSFFSSESTCYEKNSVLDIPDLVETKKPSLSTSSFPDIIIVVNTQNFEKNTIFSRRSSYQKILALEKGGAQVIEREINLPLDIIIGAALCIVWYEANNFAANAELEPKTSSVDSIMESIATNVLMSLSYAFSGCLLIFEGESNFLTAIMDSSDTLYAAAATLDMNLQLFCSHLPETTDEIILSCIRKAAMFNKCLLPEMPESETIAESFLTSFPFVNTLLAHAIICSGGTLVEFLEWSHDRRIQSVKKHQVHVESMFLFSTLCRYGELGESKSVMTECSSIDSDSNSTSNHRSMQKRMKTGTGYYTLGTQSKDLYHMSLFNQSCDELKRQPQNLNPKFQNTQTLKPEWGKILNFDTLINTNKQEPPADSGFKIGHEEIRDEVIDHDFRFLDQKYDPIPESFRFSRNPNSRSSYAFKSSMLYNNSVAGKVQCDFGTSKLGKEKDEQSFSKSLSARYDKNIHERSTIGSLGDVFVTKGANLGDDFIQDWRRDVHESAVEAQEDPDCFGSPLPNAATTGTNLLQEPNLTIELLHRLMEKRRTHQQNVKCNTSRDYAESTRSKGKSCVIQSPSIIESHRYQGGNRKKKPVNFKFTSGVKQPSSSNIERKDFPFLNPTLTPADKRARQNLAFMRNGKEKQSKLVWRSQTSPHIISTTTRKRARKDS